MDDNLNSIYELKWSPVQIIFVAKTNIFVFGMLLVIIYLCLFHLFRLPFLVSLLLMSACIVLCLVAIWNTIKPLLGHPPLRLSQQGFSVHNSGLIAWEEISHYDIVTLPGKYVSHALHFYLTKESAAEPRVRFFGKVIDPPRIALSLGFVHWNQYELLNALAHYSSQEKEMNKSERPVDISNEIGSYMSEGFYRQ